MARYEDDIRRLVDELYPLCLSPSDRRWLAERLNMESVTRLYNISSRRKVAGSNIDKSRKRRVIESRPMSEVKFSQRGDSYLKRGFGRMPVEDIGLFLDLPEAAVLYRARHLGLRKPVKHWREEKVAKWFGMKLDEFRELASEGIDFAPLAGLKGKVDLTLVSTSSIARWMGKKKNMKRLQRQGADEFFIADIKESIEDILNEKTDFELCSFLSHGHVCMNPMSQSSFGYYCTNNAAYEAGDDPRCQVKILKVEDLRPD